MVAKFTKVEPTDAAEKQARKQSLLFPPVVLGLL
jgi:hypothetical protein